MRNGRNSRKQSGTIPKRHTGKFSRADNRSNCCGSSDFKSPRLTAESKQPTGRITAKAPPHSHGSRNTTPCRNWDTDADIISSARRRSQRLMRRKRCLKNTGLSGHIVLLGTPAEESGGGKVKMLEKNGLDGIDAAMMVHPSCAPHRTPVPLRSGVLTWNSSAKRRTPQELRSWGSTHLMRFSCCSMQ